MAGQPVNLLFPVKGLSRNNPYALMPEHTTPAALNVRPEDAIDHRFRGGRRGGLSKHIASRVAESPIQHMTSGVTVANPGLWGSYKVVRAQQTADGQTHDTSVVFGAESGSSYEEVQISPDGGSDYSPKPCCFDTEGNFYVAIEGDDNYTYIYKYNSSMAFQAAVCTERNAGNTSSQVDMCYCEDWDRIAFLQSLSDDAWDGGTEDANLFLIDPSDMSIVAHHDIDGGGSIGGDNAFGGAHPGQLVWDAANEQLIVVCANHQTTYGGADAQPDKNVFAFNDSLTLQWSVDTTDSTNYEARGGCVYGDVLYVPQKRNNDTKARMYQIDVTTGTITRYDDLPDIDGTESNSQHALSNCVATSDGDIILFYACAAEPPFSGELARLNWNSGTEEWDVVWSYKKNEDEDAAAIVNDADTPGLWIDSDDNIYVLETAGPTGDSNKWVNTVDGLNVEVSMIEFSSLGAYIRYWDKNGPADSWRAYVTDRPGWGFAIYESDTEFHPITDTTMVFVQDGSVYNNVLQEYTATGTPLSTSVNDVYSTWAYQNIYFVDGTNSKVLVLLDTLADPWSSYQRQVVDWPTLVAGSGAGTMPEACRLICTYRGRVVLSGQSGDPHNWFMSAVNDPLDWDYAPATITVTQAVAGNNADAGKVGDVITALIPYNDDLLLFGGLHSIYQLSGDPMDNGSIDLLSDQTGVRFGQAFCRDPKGILYFMGTDGVYALMPVAGGGTQIQSITEGRLDNEFDSIDWSLYRARFVWDYHRAGLLITLVPYETTSAVLVYFWSQQADSWWVDSYPLTIGPTCTLPLVGESAPEQRLLFGGRDGYIRYLDDNAETDDGTAITSYVEWMIPGTPMDIQQAIAQIQAILGESSASVTLQIFRGSTAQEAAAATTPVLSRTLTAGRAMPVIHGVGGRHLRIRVYSTGNRWALEQLQLVMTGIGKGRKR
jgi:hypothetical protein